MFSEPSELAGFLLLSFLYLEFQIHGIFGDIAFGVAAKNAVALVVAEADVGGMLQPRGAVAAHSLDFGLAERTGDAEVIWLHLALVCFRISQQN